MPILKRFRFLFLISWLFFLSCQSSSTSNLDDNHFVNYVVNPKSVDLKFYWKFNDSTSYFNFKTLKKKLKKGNKELLFAVNGGMFKKDFSPQGLYIERGITLVEIDQKNEGYGNFYMQPNGVFYLTTDKTPKIIPSQKFKHQTDIEFATQSGPMLIINDSIHPAFNKGSENINIRNGVGILPNGNLLFAMSKEKINFFNFASYFKDNGCKNALYLDGFVSKTYLPSKNWEENSGKFGVIIAATKPID